MQRSRGFSLIELIVSLAIMTTIAGVASLRYGRSAERARVDATARRIASMVGDARTQARTSGGPIFVQFRATPPHVLIKNTLGAQDLASIRVDQGPYRSDLKFDPFGGDDDLTFNFMGRPDAGGDIKVTSGAFVRVVHIDPETGRATID